MKSGCHFEGRTHQEDYMSKVLFHGLCDKRLIKVVYIMVREKQ